MKNINLKTLSLFAFLLICSLFQAKVSLPGIRIEKDKIEVASLMAHDGFWHVSLIDQIKKKIPPEQPGFAGENLSNYHYFLDLIVAFLSKLSGISSLYLYFNVFPLSLAFLYGVAGFLVFSKFTKSYYWSLLGTFLLYFSNNLAFLLPLFRKGYWGENSFMLNQPIAFTQNLALLFSMILFFILILSFDHKILVSLILGITFGVKVHVALPLFLGLVFTGLLNFILNKSGEILNTVLLTSIIAGTVLLNISKPLGSLIFIPGWSLSQMIADPDRLNLSALALKDEVLRQNNALFELLYLQIGIFFIYLVGNLGIRILGTWEGVKEIIKKRFSALKFFLVISGAISLLTPVLFNQRGGVYDIVQFGEIGIVIFTIFTVIFLQRKLQSLSLVGKITAITLLLMVTLPTTLKTFHGYLNQNFLLVDKFEKDAIEFLEKKLPKEAVILVYPSAENLNSHYIQALSGKGVFYADRKTAVMTGKQYEKREKEVKSFFGVIEKEPDCGFIKRYNISYLYLLSDDKGYMKCPLHLKKIFGNQRVAVYEILD